MNLRTRLRNLQPLRAAAIALLVAIGLPIPVSAVDLTGTPGIPWRPLVYDCGPVSAPITVDGRLQDAAWSRADWSAEFVDIRGGDHPAPAFRTRVKMLWDASYLYIAAEMEEPNVWAKLTDRDAVIYFDNDFEVFVDPDGDTHEYYELEVNAFGTEWDLFLVRPYRDGGPALHEWDIPGLKTAVHVDGTLNDPSDEDRGWTMEIAFPWAALAPAAHRDTPPNPGDVWRVNFSRVQWDTEVVDGDIVKRTGPDGNSLPEHNWVWSPQGLVNMHYPEMWGFVRFQDSATDAAAPHPADDPEEALKWKLRTAYYALRFDVDMPEGVEHATTRAGFEAWIDAGPDRWLIDQTGRVRKLER